MSNNQLVKLFLSSCSADNVNQQVNFVNFINILFLCMISNTSGKMVSSLTEKGLVNFAIK